jgi:dethiobiotin synthetase
MAATAPILVTGTDTGVGKTWVGCALARGLRAAGRRVVAIKPVETGCGEPGDETIGDSEDGVLLAGATGQAEPAHAIVRLPVPVAPAVALDVADTDIDFDSLVLRIERYAKGADVVLIEGVGGVLAPITWEWNATDLAETLGARALVVAADRLGTINHTLLTLSVLELSGIPVLGVVLTTPAVADRSTGTNAALGTRAARHRAPYHRPGRRGGGAGPGARLARRYGFLGRRLTIAAAVDRITSRYESVASPASSAARLPAGSSRASAANAVARTA